MRRSAYKILLNFVQYSKFQKMYALKKIDVRPVYGPSAGAAAKEIHINMYIF